MEKWEKDYYEFEGFWSDMKHRMFMLLTIIVLATFCAINALLIYFIPAGCCYLLGFGLPKILESVLLVLSLICFLMKLYVNVKDISHL